MTDPNRIYDLLLAQCPSNIKIEKVFMGLVWTLCQTSLGHGLAMSAPCAVRTLPWSGELVEKSVLDIAAWIVEWNPHQASVAMAVINSCINTQVGNFPNTMFLNHTSVYRNLAVFDYFLPQLLGKNVVVIGHYPNIEQYQHQMQLTVLEKQPTGIDLPDVACEFLLSKADWVFITATSIPNKTFPRLAQLASSAKTVLMGPTTPWLSQLREFDIDYLAGVEIINPILLEQTIAQGGGVKIFEQCVRYRIADLAV